MTKKLKLIAFLCGTFIICKGYGQTDLVSQPANNSSIVAHTTDSSGKEALTATSNNDVTNNTSLVPSFFSRLFTKRKTIKPGSADSVASAPFAFGDFTWLNGTSRKTSPPAIDTKYFTGDITFDLNYTHSYNKPIDNTVVGSTALARNNELQLAFMGVGGDFHVDHVRGR